MSEAGLLDPDAGLDELPMLFLRGRFLLVDAADELSSSTTIGVDGAVDDADPVAAADVPPAALYVSLSLAMSNQSIVQSS